MGTRTGDPFVGFSGSAGAIIAWGFVGSGGLAFPAVELWGDTGCFPESRALVSLRASSSFDVNARRGVALAA